MDAEPIGFYSHGCLAGGVELPVNGPHWQVMRLSRNRNWGHPALIAFIERFAARSEPRQRLAGPADRRHVAAARRPDVRRPRLASDRARRRHLAHAHAAAASSPAWSARKCRRPRWCARTGSTSIPGWTEGHVAVVRAAAEDPAVERIFVNAAIKRAMCRVAAGQPWMRKVRPYYGHDYHFHVRLFCPNGLRELHGPSAGFARRRLRRLARPLVRAAVPELEAVGQDLAADDDVGAALGMPPGAEGEIGARGPCSTRGRFPRARPSSGQGSSAWATCSASSRSASSLIR